MCGIVGIFQRDGTRPSEGALNGMLRAVAHRGPDEEGRYLEGPVALGHRRLSIIDLETGRQPLTNEDESLVLVLNGEIYNYQELRAATLSRGHTYRTQSDAEVILHLYEEEGPACLSRLNGMFAFALWDKPRERLWLARDRAGKKPLYVAETPGAFLFASELKGLVAHPDVDRSLDPRGVGCYLNHGSVPAPGTLLRGATKLPPASSAIVDRDGLRWETYWRLPATRPAPRGMRDLAQEFRERFTRAVVRRLVADVPIGVLLSGGMDSSAIVAALAEAGVSPIRTFSLGINVPSFDERRYAQAVADHFGTVHRTWEVGVPEFWQVVPMLGRLVDEPIVDSSLVPTYLLARYTSQEVKVVLGGDGGDEIFGGYPTYLAHQLALIYHWFPRGVHRGVSAGMARWPVSSKYLSLEFLAKRFLAGAQEATPAARHRRWMAVASAEQVRALVAPDWRHALDLEACDQTAERFWDGADAVGGAMRCDFSRYLGDIVLPKVDRASMAVGLEVRAPFLDVELLEWVAALPTDYKVRGAVGKRLVRMAYSHRLPPLVRHRRKHGFALPVARWFRGPLRSLVGDLLSPARLAPRGLWNVAEVERVVAAHLEGRANHAALLWALVMLELWQDQVLSQVPSCEVAV